MLSAPADLRRPAAPAMETWTAEFDGQTFTVQAPDELSAQALLMRQIDRARQTANAAGQTAPAVPEEGMLVEPFYQIPPERFDAIRAATPNGPLANLSNEEIYRQYFLGQWAPVATNAENAATRAAEAEAQRQYEATRAARPLAAKVGDYTRDLLNGLTLGAGNRLVAVADQLIPGGANYEQRLAFENEQGALHRQESPVASFATEVVGGLPMLRVPGAMPSRTATLQENIATGAASAAGLGAAYTFNSAPGSLSERLAAARDSMPMAAGIGAAVPIVGRAVAPVVNAVDAAIGPTGRATSAFQAAARDSGTTPSGIAAALRRNDQLMPLDVDPNLGQLAQGIVSQPGPGRATITRELLDRQAAAPDRVTGIFDAGMGPNPDVMRTLDTIRTTAQTNAEQAFRPLLEGAGPINISPVISAIDQELWGPLGRAPANWEPRNATQRELLATREMLTGAGGQVVDAEMLHTIQSRLRRTADRLGNSVDGELQLAGDAVGDVRQALVDVIDEATGGPPAGSPRGARATVGPYRAAQQQYADDMAVEGAFFKGFDILRNPTTGEAGIQARPEYWRDWATGLSRPELEAARLGARAAVDTMMQSVRNAARSGSTLPEIGNFRDRLTFLFGPEEADRMTRALRDEREMAASTQRQLGGSQTAMRHEATAATAVPRVGGTSLVPALGTGPVAGYLLATGDMLGGLGVAAAGLGGVGIQGIRRGLAQARNAEMANVLSARGDAAQAGLAAMDLPVLSWQRLNQPNRLAELGMLPSRAAIPYVVDQ